RSSWGLSELERLYLQAITNEVLRSFGPAIEEYSEIIERLPSIEKSQALVDLGRAYENNDQIEQAIKSYVQATQLNPLDAAAFLRSGILYGRQRDTQSANDAFKTAEDLYLSLSNTEGLTETFYQRGFLLANLKELRGAREQLERAIEMTSTTGNQYQHIRALLALSSVSATEGHSTEAEDQATRAIELAGANGMENQATNGLIWLGSAFLRRGDYDRAENYYQQALERARMEQGHLNEALALVQLGSLRTLQRRTDEGLSYIHEALP